ncbi:hypothetical protein [Acidisoma sp. C75]
MMSSDGKEEARGGGGGDAAEPESAATPSAEEFRALAEDWIAIWQSEITAYLTDPETQANWSAMVALWAEAAEAMMRAMPAMGAGLGAGWAAPAASRPRRHEPAAEGRPGAPAAAGDGGTPARAGCSSEPAAPARPGAGADAAPGPAPAAAASEPRDDEVRRLERRVAELERRLAGRDGPAAEAERRRAPPGGDRRPRRGGRS